MTRGAEEEAGVLDLIDQFLSDIVANPVALLAGIGIGIVIGAAVTAAGRPWR